MINSRAMEDMVLFIRLSGTFERSTSEMLYIALVLVIRFQVSSTDMVEELN